MISKLFFIEKPRETPKVDIKYLLSKSVVRATEDVLFQYSEKIPSNEGLVFWGGAKEDNVFTVKIVIAPKTLSNKGIVKFDNRSSCDVVNTLCATGHKLIAQVHSHPSEWVDHSEGDDEMTAFKREGFLSIVTPNYGTDGILPFVKNGVHLFQDGRFIRLPDTTVVRCFEMIDYEAQLIDLR